MSEVETPVEFLYNSNSNSEPDYELELCDYDEVEEHLIDLVFQERMGLLYILDEFAPKFNGEKLFTELYVSMQHDYYYKKMPYVFYSIVKDFIKEAKTNNKYRFLIETILREFEIDVKYEVDV
jgi:hypothetical protein